MNTFHPTKWTATHRNGRLDWTSNQPNIQHQHRSRRIYVSFLRCPLSPPSGTCSEEHESSLRRDKTHFSHGQHLHTLWMSFRDNLKSFTLASPRPIARQYRGTRCQRGLWPPHCLAFPPQQNWTLFRDQLDPTLEYSRKNPPPDPRSAHAWCKMQMRNVLSVRRSFQNTSLAVLRKVLVVTWEHAAAARSGAGKVVPRFGSQDDGMEWSDTRIFIQYSFHFEIIMN